VTCKYCEAIACGHGIIKDLNSKSKEGLSTEIPGMDTWGCHRNPLMSCCVGDKSE